MESLELLLKEETVKKRLVRARKSIAQEEIEFEIPVGAELQSRMHRTMEVIYLIFNEGFHSGKKDVLIREDLCGEGIRLAKLLLTNNLTATGDAHALFALFCFHSSRLRSKIDANHEIISLKDQDRNLWYKPLINLGLAQLDKGWESEKGIYHYEAAIAAEHVRALNYESTDWSQILKWYRVLNEMQSSAFIQLNMSTVLLQLANYTDAKAVLESIDQNQLEQRVYLYYGLWAEYYMQIGQLELSLKAIDQAIELVCNESEKAYLEKKRQLILVE